MYWLAEEVKLLRNRQLGPPNPQTAGATCTATKVAKAKRIGGKPIARGMTERMRVLL
jgi:hypothetical protein